MYKIISKKSLNFATEEMVVHAPFVAKKCEPGQFIMLRVKESGERIPLTIVKYDRKEETVTIVYQIVGCTTEELSKKKEDDFILDFVGPLGNPTELKMSKKVLGIGGGVGAASLYPQLKKLSEMGVSIDAVLGGRTKDHIILEDDFSKCCGSIFVTTDDGSKGEKGFVTDVLKSLIKEGRKYDEIIAIGPVLMMKAVSLMTKEKDIKTSVSLNPIMVDGTGMCGSCRVTIGGETKFACVDGPDFDGHLVDYDELMRRQMMFKEEENHICKIGRGNKKNG